MHQFWGRLASGDDSGWDEALESCIRQESSAGQLGKTRRSWARSVDAMLSNLIYSMYGIFTNLSPANDLNVGKCSIHGASGNDM